MRVVVIVGLILIAAFGLTRYRAHQAAEEAERREQQAAKEHAEWRKQQAARQQEEDRRVMTLMNCGTVERNLPVLEEALAKGTGVHEWGPGVQSRTLEPHEVRMAYDEHRQYQERNCRR
jgi:hypothetical protein